MMALSKCLSLRFIMSNEDLGWLIMSMIGVFGLASLVFEYLGKQHGVKRTKPGAKPARPQGVKK